jgi:hypothetical protein
MVTIVDYKARTSEDGREFNVLILQGDLEMIQSKETGKFYATAKKCSISCTFDDITCSTLIGKTLPGQIEKVEVDPYEYNVPGTDEIITLTHTYFYDPVPKTMEQQVFAAHATSLN